MREKPNISPGLISTNVQRIYGFKPCRVTFLPLGYDIHTAIYQVERSDGSSYFLKLRNGDFAPVTVELPKFLCQQGISCIIAPQETMDGLLYGQMDSYTTILFPFVPGQDGYTVQLADRHWIQLGQALKWIHETHLPMSMAGTIPVETFDPQWRRSAGDFLTQIDQQAYLDPVSQKLAEFMRSKRDLIRYMISRADALAEDLQQQAMEFVLCHGDAHPGNYHIADTGEVYLVDWDTPIFAPRERDLMCFGGGMVGDQPGGQQERLFYEGYGPVDVNWKALAYYRYERIIQDIAEFCKQIFLTGAGGKDRAQSLDYLVSSFQPCSLVEAAVQTDRT